MNYEILLFHLGIVAGGLSVHENKRQLIEHLKNGDLNPKYIELLLEELLEVMVAAGLGIADSAKRSTNA